MLNNSTLDELPSLRLFREKIRSWWGLEVGVTDARGYVSDHAEGVVNAPHNEYCQAALSNADGFRRCNRSVEQATDVLKTTPEETGARIVQPCHLGFPLAMAPVLHQGDFYGSVFTGGFFVEGHEEAARYVLRRNMSDLGLLVDNTNVPILNERDLNYLGDLLETIAKELSTLVVERNDPRRFGGLIGTSPGMQRLYLMLEKVANSDATVLIIGENGTGKEVVARAIHGTGPRADHSFVAANCSALNDNLLETELFGHVKGAFTGAIRDKDGLFQVADGGTLFLDEVGDTSAAMQVKLLRVLQEGTFMPVGATQPVTVDVRVIAATNRPLREMVENGSFREDLYYRLNVIGLEIPPLRERKTDLPDLVEHFLDRLHRKKGGLRKSLSPEVMSYFWEYNWPGNVRQLENEVERLLVLSGAESVVGPEMLSPAVRTSNRSERIEAIPAEGTLEEAVQALERRMIRSGLVRTGWNKSRLSRELGISRTTLIKKIRELGLEERPQAARS